MIEAFPAESDLPTRLKRARMRAWRRGMREMDLLLGGFIDAQGAGMNAAQLDDFERLLARRDQDLYDWISGRASDGASDATDGERALIRRIASGTVTFEKNSP